MQSSNLLATLRGDGWIRLDILDSLSATWKVARKRTYKLYTHLGYCKMPKCCACGLVP